MKIENWNGHDIRFAEHDGEWWAVAKDVADALGYSETAAMTRHMKDKYFMSVKLAGMNMKSTIISEHSVYKAIMRSERPEAESFEDWAFDVIKKLRQSTGLEGFHVFRVMDKDHQKLAIDMLHDGLENADKKYYIKANSIANKAVSTLYGFPKMIKKDDMTPDMLKNRQAILEDAVRLMVTNEQYGLGISVSQAIYKKYGTAS